MTDEMKKYFAELLEYAINQYMSLGLPHIITEKDNPHSAIYLSSWNPTDDQYYWKILEGLDEDKRMRVDRETDWYRVLDRKSPIETAIFYNTNRKEILTAVYETREK